jgi:hypothetical protein
VGSESNSFSPKEFLAKLAKDDFARPLALTGMVKPDDSTSDGLLFVPGTRCGSWTQIPANMIDTVEVLGSAPCGDHSHQRVTLTFKAPKSPEAATFAALLNAVSISRQGGPKRMVRKTKGGGATGAAQTSPSVYAGGCGCSDFEIDLEGTVWVLTDVVDFDDGSCICTYQHG